MLRRNRENHYGINNLGEVTIKRKPTLERPREIPQKPLPPTPPRRIPDHQLAPRPVVGVAKPASGSYNPLAARPVPAAPRPIPTAPKPQQSYNPLKSAVPLPMRPTNPEVDLVKGLANLKNTIPETDTRLIRHQNPGVSRLQNEAKTSPPPKQRKINPKDDPNCAYCFRCQEWHRKDLHMAVLPVPQLPRKKTTIAGGMIPSRSSQLTDRQLANQKADLAKAIFDLPPPPRQKKRREVYQDEEDEDDFDYDDGFLAPEDEDEMDYRKHLRKITGYNPSAYDDADFDDRDMEVRSFAELEREDRRSRAIGSIRSSRQL